MLNLVKIIETKCKGTYVIEDSGVNYIYDEATNDLHEANNVEMGFYRPNRFGSFDYECDNWHSWK